MMDFPWPPLMEALRRVPSPDQARAREGEACSVNNGVSRVEVSGRGPGDNSQVERAGREGGS